MKCVSDRTIVKFNASLVGGPCNKVCPNRGGEKGEDDSKYGFQADGGQSEMNEGGDENQYQAHRRGLTCCVHSAKYIRHSIQTETTDYDKKESSN